MRSLIIGNKRAAVQWANYNRTSTKPMIIAAHVQPFNIKFKNTSSLMVPAYEYLVNYHTASSIVFSFCIEMIYLSVL